MLGRLCVFGGLCEACDDWYANGHFCCFDCLLTVFGRPVTIGTPMVIFAVLTVFLLFLTFLTIGTLSVQSWQTCDDWYTNAVRYNFFSYRVERAWNTIPTRKINF